MSETDEKPTNWPLRVRAAYLRMKGRTQQETGDEVERTRRTIRRWENDPTWSDALTEARDRWMQDLVQEASATLITAIRNGDPVRAMQVLERLDPDLAPVAQKLEHSGEIDVPSGLTVHFVDADAG